MLLFFFSQLGGYPYFNELGQLVVGRRSDITDLEPDDWMLESLVANYIQQKEIKGNLASQPALETPTSQVQALYKELPFHKATPIHITSLKLLIPDFKVFVSKLLD